jgi:hypothetical protein
MHQPPQRLLRQAVTAVAAVMLSEHLPPGRQEALRQRAKTLTLKVEKAMGAATPDEKLVVWEGLNDHAFRQNRNKHLHDTGVEGY